MCLFYTGTLEKYRALRYTKTDYSSLWDRVLTPYNIYLALL